MTNFDAHHFITWLRGYAAGCPQEMDWRYAWTAIEEKLDTLEEKDTIPTPPQVSYRSDVVDTDNKWPETAGQLTPAGTERLHRIIKDRG